MEVHLILPPCNVASQLDSLTLVEIAIIIVADGKQAWVSTSKHTLNVLQSQAINPRKPIDIIAKIMTVLTKNSFCGGGPRRQGLQLSLPQFKCLE